MPPTPFFYSDEVVKAHRCARIASSGFRLVFECDGYRIYSRAIN